MKIAICDDDAKYVNELKAHIEKYMNDHFIKSAEYFVTTSSKEILNNDTAYDLAFLDIQMPEADGITLAKELKRRNEKIILFFVTNFEEYQDEAMDLHIFRFFEKPFDVQRLYAGLDKAMEFIDESYVDIFLEKNNEYIKIPVDDICYIKRENRCISVVTKNGTFITKGNFNDLISKLPNTYFYLVHKSFMINVHHVTKYSYKEIYIGKDRIGIATRKQADFHKFWFNYVKRR